MAQPAPRIAAPDPLIDEIRQYRVDLDKRFAGDWDAYGAFIREGAARIRKEFSLMGANDSAKAQSASKSQ